MENFKPCIGAFDISLIISTYGRYEEVKELLQSIAAQDYDLSKIEVIVIDQNDQIDLSDIIRSFDTLHIVHQKSNIKGLAHSKNIGISLASAPVITFPDDDCTFYENTVSSALDYFRKNNEVDIIYGRVYDREQKRNIMRNWQEVDKTLNLVNFHLNYSAITCFSKQKGLLFDTNFGVGAYYSLGEELDYVIRAIKEKLVVRYTSSVDIWHPELNVQSMNENKVYKYAEGYGAVLKKHLCPELFMLYVSSTLMQGVHLLRAVLKRDKTEIGKRKLAIKGRLVGFSKFKRS